MQREARTGRFRAVGVAALLVCSVLAGGALTGTALAAVGEGGAVEHTADETPPTADAGSNRTVAPGTELTFDGSGSSDDESIEWYLWDVDGDGRTDAMGENGTYEFAQPGVYEVTLTVIDGSGNTDTDTTWVTVRDTTPPTADTGPNKTVGVGSSVQFVATGSSDDHAVDEYRWDFDGDGRTDATGSEPRRTFDEPGTYEVTLTVADAAGNTDTDTVTVTVTADAPVTNESTTDGTATDGEEATTDSESTTGSGATDDAAADTETSTADRSDEPDPVVSVDRGANATTVDVAKATGPTTVHLANATDRKRSAAPVRVDRLTVDASASEYTLDVSTRATVPGNRSAPTRTETGDLDGGYLRIDHSLSSDAVSEATVAFTVGWPALAEGTSASEVVLYRYHDGEWRPVETEHLGYTAAGARFEATTSNLSVFAVGARLAPNVTVEPSVEQRTVGVEQPVNVSANVTNDGTASKLVVVALRSNGTTLDTDSVPLGVNDSATLALRTSFERPGEYDLVVEDTEIGTVTVTDELPTTPTPPTATATPTATPTPEATATSVPAATSAQTPTANASDGRSSEAGVVSGLGAGGPGLGAGLVALAALALAGAFRRHRD